MDQLDAYKPAWRNKGRDWEKALAIYRALIQDPAQARSKDSYLEQIRDLRQRARR
jgi:hypothetical protein